MANSITTLEAANPNSVLDTMAQIKCTNKINVPLAVLEENNDYVLTLYLRSSGTSTFRVGCLVDIDNDITLIADNIDSIWSKVQVKFKGIKGSNIYIEFPKGTYFVYNPKLEVGTIATAYSQNQIDFKQMVETLSASIDVEIGKITQTVTSEIKRIDGLEETVKSQGSVVEQTADAISHKVWEKDINGKYIASQINQSADNILIEAKHIKLKGAISYDCLDEELADMISDTISSVKVLYGESKTQTEAPTAWSETCPAYSATKYVWQKTVTYYTNDTDPVESTPTCISGYNGKSVTAVIPLYYASSTANVPTINKDTPISTTAAHDAWSTVQPQLNKDYSYIYTCSKITYSSGDPTFSTVTITDTLSILANWCDANDKTLINGGKIATGTVGARQINVKELFAEKIEAKDFTITGGKIKTEKKEWGAMLLNKYMSGSSRVFVFMTGFGLYILDDKAKTYSNMSVGSVSSGTYVGSIPDDCEDMPSGLVFTPKASISYSGNAMAYNNYDITTTNSPNVHALANGLLRRSTSSSRRYKRDITANIPEELNPHKLYDLEIKSYKYNDDYLSENDRRYQKDILGFIAEDVQEVFEPAVQYDDEGNAEMWNINVIVPAMLKLIQEQHAEIENLKAVISDANNQTTNQ